MDNNTVDVGNIFITKLFLLYYLDIKEADRQLMITLFPEQYAWVVANPGMIRRD